MQLVVMIETGRTDVYRGPTLDLAPPAGLRASRPIAYEPVVGGWRGETEIDDAPDDCERDVALHLRALREASRASPAWRFHIELAPDGGVLELVAGSFGDDEEDVAALLRWTESPALALDGAHVRLYASVRLPDDAHRHLIDLVVGQLPPGWPRPVVEASLGAIALGFELTGDAARTAQLISALRTAWLLEGSAAQCLVELEGDPPIVRQLAALADWTALERDLRAADAARRAAEQPQPPPPPSPPPSAAPGPVVASPGLPYPLLGSRRLTWLDPAGRILGLGADGDIRDLGERREHAYGRPVAEVADDGTRAGRDPGRADHDGHGYWRRHGRAPCLRVADRLIELPAEPGSVHSVVGSCRSGLLLVEGSSAGSRLRLLDESGACDGPVFRNVAGIAFIDDSFAALACDIGGYPALVTVCLRNWGWGHSAPWPQAAVVTDLARLGGSYVVAVANVGGAGELYVIAGFSGELERTVYLPCREPRIVHAEGTSVWLTGASPGAGAARHDLFCVDLAGPGTTTMLTSGASATGWGSLRAVRQDAGWILAYERRGVFALGDGLEPVVALDEDEQLTAICAAPLLAVFATGPRGSRLLLGEQQPAAIPLPSPGFDPMVG